MRETGSGMTRSLLVAVVVSRAVDAARGRQDRFRESDLLTRKSEVDAPDLAQRGSDKARFLCRHLQAAEF
jgi:hypothetical protein